MRYLALALTIGCSGPSEVEMITQAMCAFDDPCCPGSPVVIDVAGDGIRLTSWERGVTFGLRPGFSKSQLSWTELGSDDAWLVMDRNSNGRIDDGAEMFGNFTQQVPVAGEMRNGFVALAKLDANGDGIVDAKDPAFVNLRLWQDRNHDGLSQPEELSALPALGVSGLSTIYTESPLTDSYGNRFRYRATVYEARGSRVGMWAWDVFLTGTKPSAPEVSGTGLVADGEECGGGTPPGPINIPANVWPKTRVCTMYEQVVICTQMGDVFGQPFTCDSNNVAVVQPADGYHRVPVCGGLFRVATQDNCDFPNTYVYTGSFQLAMNNCAIHSCGYRCAGGTACTFQYQGAQNGWHGSTSTNCQTW